MDILSLLFPKTMGAAQQADPAASGGQADQATSWIDDFLKSVSTPGAQQPTAAPGANPAVDPAAPAEIEGQTLSNFIDWMSKGKQQVDAEALAEKARKDAANMRLGQFSGFNVTGGV